MSQEMQVPGKKVDDEGYVHGYADEHGNFLGYAPYMTLIPGLIPSKFHVKSGIIVPTGNPKNVKKGNAIITDAGFGPGGSAEQVLSGLEEDKGADLAPSGSIPGTAIPEPNDGPVISPELQAKIDARKAAKEAKDK